MMAGTGVSVGGAGMLRTRRRDVSVKPNRKLDRKSSRGMIYENEELRLRTIHINAEVEQGQNDIKKLRRENEQLRREIWSLRDEYDKLEDILKRQKSHEESEEYEDRSEEDDGLQSDYSCEDDEELEGDENNEGTSKELNKDEQLENVENQKISSEKMTSSSLHRLHVDFDDLSVVDEEEELRKDREKKEVSSEDGQQKDGTRSPPPILRPRQLHENIPFYPATYEPSNTISGSTYYTECPFEFPSTVDLMLPADTPGLLGSPCSRLQHGDPLMSVGSLDPPGFERVGDQMLPQIHVPPLGWQSNVIPQKQLQTYPTASGTPAAVPSTGIQMLDTMLDPRVHHETRTEHQQQQQQQRFPSTMGSGFSNFPPLLQRRNQLPKGCILDAKSFEDLQTQHSGPERMNVENGWEFHGSSLNEKNTLNDQKPENLSYTRIEGKNNGTFSSNGSERPKHFFAPLPSKMKKQIEESSPTTSHFGTGNSSSSGKTGSTVISKSRFSGQKGSADIYVNGAIPYDDSTLKCKDEQRTFLSTDNLLIAEDKTNVSNPLIKSMSCQNLTSDSQNAAISEQLKMNNGECRQQLHTKSENTLDNLSSDISSKPYKSHLSVTLKKPHVNQAISPDTPEIPKLPSMDYRLFNNPFLRTFDPSYRNYTDQESQITRPLSVQVNEDNLCYHYQPPADLSTFTRAIHPTERFRPAHGQSDQSRLLIPSNQLLGGKILSPVNKHDIQVTSFERPSPHTLIPPATPYDINTLRRLNANPYLHNRSLYQNVPFVPRGPTHIYSQRGAPVRMYYDNSTIKVPAQTQTSIDGDSHQEEDQTLSQQDEESISVPSSPNGQRRKKTIRKEKTGTITKEQQKPLSPAAQRRLKKQSSVTSSETPESPGKLARKRPRKLSITTTTTTSEGHEDKNESRSSSSGQDSPRKDQTRRVSLYFNTKKRPSLTSVKTARSGSLDTTKDKYAEAVTNSERERTNSISSRENTAVKGRKSSTSSGNVPWCACWGNGCI